MEPVFYMDEVGPGVILNLRNKAERVAPLKQAYRICESPLCACTEVNLIVEDASSAGHGSRGSCEICLDPERQVLGKVRSRHLDPALENLGERVVAKMTSKDWGQLQDWFIEAKETQLAAANPATLNPCFPPELALDPSLLISFGGIVPCARPLLFNLDGMTWQAMDDYCVNAPCTCNQAHLTFRAWPEGAPWGPSVHQDECGVGPVACLALPGPGWTTVEPSAAGAPSLAALVAGLEAAWPALRQILADRRRILRRLAAVSTVRPRASIEPLLPARSTKVGRNEQCPCGSGKKFKRCCGVDNGNIATTHVAIASAPGIHLAPRPARQAKDKQKESMGATLQPAWDTNDLDAYELKMEEWAARDWCHWLGQKLAFPFKAKREEDSDEAFFTDVAAVEPFRLGHTMDVVGMEPGEEVDFGVLVEVREGRHKGHVPLADLEVRPKSDKNFWPVREYVVWFANRM